MTSARERQRRVLANLPPLEGVLRGSVGVRFLRCGKSGCHCAEGEGHRATYFSVTLPGGKTEQISLPAELVSQVEHGIATYHTWWAAVEKISALNRAEIRRQRRQQSQLRRRSAVRSSRPRRPR
jgi:hypothetical protein